MCPLKYANDSFASVMIATAGSMHQIYIPHTNTRQAAFPCDEVQRHFSRFVVVTDDKSSLKRLESIQHQQHQQPKYDGSRTKTSLRKITAVMVLHILLVQFHGPTFSMANARALAFRSFSHCIRSCVQLPLRFFARIRSLRVWCEW